MKKFMLFSVTLAFLFSATIVCAQDAQPQPSQPSPEQIQEKLKAAVKAEFATVDVNGDGAISLDEFIDYSTQEAKIKAENTFNNFDTDNDGLLSEDEYLTALQNMMRQLAEQIKNSIKQEEEQQQ